MATGLGKTGRAYGCQRPKAGSMAANEPNFMSTQRYATQAVSKAKPLTNRARVRRHKAALRLRYGPLTRAAEESQPALQHLRVALNRPQGLSAIGIFKVWDSSRISIRTRCGPVWARCLLGSRWNEVGLLSKARPRRAKPLSAVTRTRDGVPCSKIVPCLPVSRLGR